MDDLHQPAERAAVILAAPFASAAGLRVAGLRIGRRGVGGTHQLRDGRAGGDGLFAGRAILSPV